MRSWIVEGEGLARAELPRPKPGPGEVLVRVRAAGVTTTELGWEPTRTTAAGAPRERAVPAHEFSGEVAECGEGAGGLAIGAAVYGMNDWYQDGALAEFCLTRPEWIAARPRLDDAAAASVPLPALTAWQGLFERGGLRAGERLLVHGGAGAVGVYVLQFARRAGAHVIATASRQNFDFVKSLGADEVVDYRAGWFAESVREIDLVFDGAGGETLTQSFRTLKPNGRAVTVVSARVDTSGEAARPIFFIVEPRRAELEKIGAWLDAGELRPVVDAVVPFDRAPDAYSGRAKKSRRGKLVVAV